MMKSEQTTKNTHCFCSVRFSLSQTIQHSQQIAFILFIISNVKLHTYHPIYRNMRVIQRKMKSPNFFFCFFLFSVEGLNNLFLFSLSSSISMNSIFDRFFSTNANAEKLLMFCCCISFFCIHVLCCSRPFVNFSCFAAAAAMFTMLTYLFRFSFSNKKSKLIFFLYLKPSNFQSSDRLIDASMLI